MRVNSSRALTGRVLSRRASRAARNLTPPTAGDAFNQAMQGQTLPAAWTAARGRRRVPAGVARLCEARRSAAADRRSARAAIPTCARAASRLEQSPLAGANSRAPTCCRTSASAPGTPPSPRPASRSTRTASRGAELGNRPGPRAPSKRAQRHSTGPRRTTTPTRGSRWPRRRAARGSRVPRAAQQLALARETARRDRAAAVARRNAQACGPCERAGRRARRDAACVHRRDRGATRAKPRGRVARARTAARALSVGERRHGGEPAGIAGTGRGRRSRESARASRPISSPRASGSSRATSARRKRWRRACRACRCRRERGGCAGLLRFHQRPEDGVSGRRDGGVAAFDGGVLRTTFLIRTEAQQEALAGYSRAILTAMGEVENALAAEKSLSLRAATIGRQVEGHRRSVELTRVQLEVGKADEYDVLQQQVQLYRAQSAQLRLGERAARPACEPAPRARRRLRRRDVRRVPA